MEHRLFDATHACAKCLQFQLFLRFTDCPIPQLHWRLIQLLAGVPCLCSLSTLPSRSIHLLLCNSRFPFSGRHSLVWSTACSSYSRARAPCMQFQLFYDIRTARSHSCFPADQLLAGVHRIRLVSGKVLGDACWRIVCSATGSCLHYQLHCFHLFPRCVGSISVPLPSCHVC